MLLTDLPDSDVNALYTAFLTLIILLINSVVSWLSNKKHKKDTQAKLETISKEVKETKYEVSANGGETTMKDVLNKMSIKIDQLDEKVDRLDAQTRGRTELALDQS